MVVDESLAVVEGERHHVMLMVGVGANHYSLRLDIIAYDNSIGGSEIIGRVEILRQSKGLVSYLGRLHAIKAVKPDVAVADVVSEYIPAVLKQLYAIRLYREGITM